MKTINKKSEKEQASKHVHDLLVEDLKGHHLLESPTPRNTYSNVSQLIELKKTKDLKIQASKLLVSSISLCLSFMIVIGMFEWRSSDRLSDVNLELSTREFDDLLDIPQTQQIQKPPVQAQAPLIIEVPDEEIIEEIEINLDIDMTEDTRIEEVTYQNQEEEIMPEEVVDEIFVIVEQQPLPQGGLKAFYQHVADNLKYPNQARRMGIEGRVFLEFVVERDGSLTDIKVARGIGAGCDEEAMRVIASSPNWNPGKQRGRAVRVRMVMPITFRLVK